MREKIYKIINLIKKNGFFPSLKKMVKYINSKYFYKINILEFLNKKKYSEMIDSILSGNYDRIIIWKSNFGWNVPLFQRPQHISINLANNNCLIFYEVTKITDEIDNIKKLYNNLFLINFNNFIIKNLLFKKLKNINKPKYIQIYSTDYIMKLRELKKYIFNGFKIIYEYIDDLSPEIIGTKKIPKNQIDKYNYILKDTNNVFVIVTAHEIEKDILRKRGNEKLAFCCNGVDYKHFQLINKNFEFEQEYKNILNNKKPIIGYYGALANWFDYNLIKYLAKNRPQYNIVLFGIKYDSSFEKSNLKSFSNIFFLGPRKYSVLPNYASTFDVCTIPFLINSITQSTSPLKLFEYMALKKPIVTTPMNECQKYKSVFIANTYEEYINLIDKCIFLKDPLYFKLLTKEALENSWENKSKSIINLLEVFE